MSPKKEKPKANTNVTLEEYQQAYRSGCRYVVPEGQYDNIYYYFCSP